MFMKTQNLFTSRVLSSSSGCAVCQKSLVITCGQKCDQNNQLYACQNNKKSCHYNITTYFSENQHALNLDNPGEQDSLQELTYWRGHWGGTYALVYDING